MSHYDDPMDSADDPEVQASEYYGQARLDAFYGILVKGVGKIPFDDSRHTIKDKHTIIKFDVIPLAEHNFSRPLSRDYIAEFGEWPKITLPSIKALGISVRQLNDAWVKIAVVPDGRTYEKNGETKQSSTFKLLAVYPDENACRAAYNGVTVTPQAAPPNANGNAERTVALKFIPTFVKSCDGDPDRLGKMLAANSLVAKYFSITSPEVIQAMTAFEAERLSRAA